MFPQLVNLCCKKKLYRKKAIYSFFPKILLKFDPGKNDQVKHWESQKFGDNHGYEKYDTPANQKQDSPLFNEIKARIDKDKSILDLGCNCGRQLSGLKSLGYKKLTGLDICQSAIDYGRKRFGLEDMELMVGRHEKLLPQLVARKRVFDLVYSSGAMMILVHPSFDIIKNICSLSSRYVILLNEENLGHSYPRLTEYEFNRHGFELVKFLRPADGSLVKEQGEIPSSIAVYERISA